MTRPSFHDKCLLITMLLVFQLSAATAMAQTNGFTYQGRLTDGGTAANGNYDLQFALFDSLSGGSQVGSTQTINTVAVSNGVFTVSLDFGANAFPGASRFLEISARPSGGGSFTLLTPRQQITSTPYAVRSLNASSADSVPASGVPAGSGNYIQNSSSPQPTSNFNISGNGTAGGTLSGNVVNATTQINLNGSRVLNAQNVNSPDGGTLAVGISAGPSSLGSSSGNAFFGNFAGQNLNSQANSCCNSFFGALAGQQNTTGTLNSFFGAFAGLSTTTASSNSFFGGRAGINTTGSDNSFFGANAGQSNATGSGNVIIGNFANVLSSNLTNATAIGNCSQVGQSNSLILGANGFSSNCGQSFDTNVGIGTTTPSARLHVVGTTGLVGHVGIGTAAPLRALQIGPGFDAGFTFEQGGSPDAGFIRFGDNTGWKLHFGRNREASAGTLNSSTVGVLMTIQDNGNVGIGTLSPDAKLTVNGTADKPGGGSWASFSDERLKNIKGNFTAGLRAVMQLQPLRYEYKRDNALNLKSEGEHIGFSAQAVQKIIPEAVSTNDKGYLLVNNDPILWTMLNAIKEQQAQIQQQRELIERQQASANRQQQQLNALKKLACRSHRRARVCR